MSLNNEGRVTSINGAWLSRYIGCKWSEITYNQEPVGQLGETLLLNDLIARTSEKLVSLKLSGLTQVMARCNKEDYGFSITLVNLEDKAVEKSSEQNLNINAACCICDAQKIDLDSSLLTSEKLLEIAKQEGKYELKIAELDRTCTTTNPHKELELALTRAEFKIYYQPILRLPDLSLASVEALARWEHPKRGLVAPNEFIHNLHKYRLMERFDRFLIDQVIADLIRWGRDDMTVSINVSPSQLAKTNFVTYLLSKTKQHSINTHQLQIEITEDSEHSEAAANSVNRLRKEGYSVIMDDFGTGYSNINNLRTMALSAIKIDKSLLLDNDEHVSDQEGFFTRVVHLCKSITRSVVVEGVESKEHEKLARQSGATFVQGFLYAKPLSTQDLETSKIWSRRIGE